VNATTDPPICKLVDYKKFKFVAKKKEKEKKKQEVGCSSANFYYQVWILSGRSLRRCCGQSAALIAWNIALSSLFRLLWPGAGHSVLAEVSGCVDPTACESGQSGGIAKTLAHDFAQ
jgi:hypothetical protein